MEIDTILDKIESDEMKRSDSSNDNAIRIEPLWSGRLQTQLEKWGKRAADKSVLHSLAAKKNKIRFRIFGITASLLTLIVGIITPYLEKDIIYAIVLALAACLSAINVACNFGELAQRHLAAEDEYSKLIMKMEYILACSKTDRAPADVTMTEIRFTMAEIAAAAPDI